MKRSEFYAFFIVMMVLMTASISYAVSYQPQIIQPTKPATAYLLQSSPSSGTYYEVANVTGKGIMQYASVYGATSSLVYPYLYLRITIDGGTPLILNPQMTVYVLAGESSHVGSNAMPNERSVVYKNLVYFKTSLKVEIMQNQGSDDIFGVVHYATE